MANPSESEGQMSELERLVALIREAEAVSDVDDVDVVDVGPPSGDPEDKEGAYVKTNTYICNQKIAYGGATMPTRTGGVDNVDNADNVSAGGETKPNQCGDCGVTPAEPRGRIMLVVADGNGESRICSRCYQGGAR